jgi:Lipocalin-like domain
MSRSASLALLFVLCTSIGSPRAEDKKEPLVGTWKVTSFTLLELPTNKTSRPYGDNPTGYLQYSSDGHMVTFQQSGDPKRPTNFPYTDEDRVNAHRSILGAYAGTYTVEGDQVVHHVIASWRPEWIGTDKTRYFTIEGNELTIKTAPQTSAVAAGETVAIETFERLE